MRNRSNVCVLGLKGDSRLLLDLSEGREAQRRTGAPVPSERQNKGSNSTLAGRLRDHNQNPRDAKGLVSCACGVGKGVEGSVGWLTQSPGTHATRGHTETHTGQRRAENKQAKNKQKLEFALTPSCSGCHGAVCDWTARLWVRVEKRWKGPSDDLEEGRSLARKALEGAEESVNQPARSRWTLTAFSRQRMPHK
jgi:hypothetical protein